MDSALYLLGILLLFLVCLAGLFSLLLGLPGTFLIVAAALVYAWATGFASVGWTTIGWLLVLAVAGEGVELLAGAAGATGERPSRRVAAAALLGGFVGGIVGTPLLFGVGSLLGALAGAFIGAALGAASEGSSAEASIRVGLAAFRGRLLGFVLKAAIAVAMVVGLAAAVL